MSDKNVLWVYYRPHKKARDTKSEALWLGLALIVLLLHCVESVHLCLKFLGFLVGHGWLIVDVVILEYLREHVGNSLAFRVAHGIDSSVGTFSHELMLQPVAVAVATDDATNFPEAEVVEEVAARNAYLAHE